MVADGQVTLRHIAERANVSIAAVSYALHGKGRMSAQTRDQLETMLRDAGYKPSYKLRPVLYLNTHRALRDMHSLQPLLSKYEGINACFRANDIPLRLEMLDLPGSPSLDEQLSQLMNYRPSGVLLDSDLSEEMSEAAGFFADRDIAAVQLGHVPRATGIDSVVVDSFGGAYAGTGYLIAQGHTRIATIRWNIEHDPASRQKHAGFRCAMEEAGLTVRDEYMVEAPPGRTDAGQPGRIAVDRLLGLADPPTAVFIENSFVSPSLLYPMPPEEAVPPQIAALEMVHFEAWSLDWIEQVVVSKLNFPPRQAKLLRTDWYQLGLAAGERMLARLEGDAAAPQATRLSPRLMLVCRDDEQTPLA